MIQLNTTFCILPSDKDLFTAWVNDVYLPAILNIEDTCPRFLKILADDDESMSFAVQFSLPDLQQAEDWASSFLLQLTEQASKAPYGLTRDRLLHFTTLMEIL